MSFIKVKKDEDNGGYSVEIENRHLFICSWQIPTDIADDEEVVLSLFNDYILPYRGITEVCSAKFAGYVIYKRKDSSSIVREHAVSIVKFMNKFKPLWGAFNLDEHKLAEAFNKIQGRVNNFTFKIYGGTNTINKFYSTSYSYTGSCMTGHKVGNFYRCACAKILICFNKEDYEEYGDQAPPLARAIYWPQFDYVDRIYAADYGALLAMEQYVKGNFSYHRPFRQGACERDDIPGMTVQISPLFDKEKYDVPYLDSVEWEFKICLKNSGGLFNVNENLYGDAFGLFGDASGLFGNVRRGLINGDVSGVTIDFNTDSGSSSLTGCVTNIYGIATYIGGDVSHIFGDVTSLCGNASDRLCGCVTNIRGSISNIYGDASNIKGEVRHYLSGDVSNICGDVTGLYGEISGQTGDGDRRKYLHGDVSHIKGDIIGVYGNVSNICGDVTRIFGDASEVCGDVTFLSGEISNILGDISRYLGGDVSKINGDISRLSGTISNAAYGCVSAISGDVTGVYGNLEMMGGCKTLDKIYGDVSKLRYPASCGFGDVSCVDVCDIKNAYTADEMYNAFNRIDLSFIITTHSYVMDLSHYMALFSDISFIRKNNAFGIIKFLIKERERLVVDRLNAESPDFYDTNNKRVTSHVLISCVIDLFKMLDNEKILKIVRDVANYGDNYRLGVSEVVRTMQNDTVNEYMGLKVDASEISWRAI